jgi:2-dehydro-3-deoxygalactonokinase
LTPVLIGVDWGTSAFRAYLLAATGAIIARHESHRGILAVANGAFEAVLEEAVAAWRAAHPKLPVIMSGMIGSRQGWIEAPYVPCPASAKDLSLKLIRVPARRLTDAHIIPGVAIEDERGVPDVMRGEETQIAGALALQNATDGVFVLPGSHAKWVTVNGSAIRLFRTYMTGEVFQALKQHTILGRLMTDEPGTGQGFAEGVRRARGEDATPGRLLNLLFSARTLGLFSKLPASEISDYLSGLLIGAELIDALDSARPFTIIANPELSARYLTAAQVIGLKCQRAPEDCVVHGHVALARAAGLIEVEA